MLYTNGSVIFPFVTEPQTITTAFPTPPQQTQPAFNLLQRCVDRGMGRYGLDAEIGEAAWFWNREREITDPND